MNRSVIHGDSFPDVALHYLTSLLKRREYANVVKYYEDNRSEFDAFGGTRAGESLHLVSQAYASLNNHPAALRTARLAQQEAVAEGDSVLLAEIFSTIGSVLIRLGEYKEAEKAFRDAESIFRRNDQLEGQCRALNQLSGLFFRQNDYQNSLAILTDALNIAHQLGDTKKTAYMMGNLGRLNTFLGDFPEATKHLQLNIDVSTELDDWLEVGRAYLSLAYVHIQTGEYQTAEEYLQKAKEFLSKQKSERDNVIYLTYLGELYRHMGRLTESESILKTALKQAEEIAPGTTLAGRAMRHLAELYVIEQKFPAAGRMAAKSMTIMQKASDRVECGALYKLKAVIAGNCQDKAACQKFFSLSIGLLSDSGVRFEKADALVKAGISEVFSKKKRLMFLFRAEEFYARYRIAPQLDKVGALIQELGEVGSGRTASKPAKKSAESEFLTDSTDIKRFMSQLAVIGKMDLTILLTGETGVGKDHMARYYHSQVRPDGPFVAINCASVPETLLESELFGYKKGAFTGANSDKLGLFASANGGVLFLDEIGDMPFALQAKLLGVLEHRRVLPLGSTKEVKLDVALVAATNHNLEEMVEQGQFRRDLYYRLSGMTYHIPALRERKEDIPLLLNHFINGSSLNLDSGKIPEEMLQQFLEYDWPGNVRELQNKVKKLEVMAQLVAEGDLVELTRSLLSTGDEIKDHSLTEKVAEFERQLIVEALLAAKGNKSRAARFLGIHEATVRTKLKRYGISLAG